MRGNLTGNVDIVINRNAVGEYIVLSNNEIGPIAFGLTPQEGMLYAIAFLEGHVIPDWNPIPSLRPIDNPFLTGPEKLQLIMDFERISAALDEKFREDFH